MEVFCGDFNSGSMPIFSVTRFFGKVRIYKFFFPFDGDYFFWFFSGFFYLGGNSLFHPYLSVSIEFWRSPNSGVWFGKKLKTNGVEEKSFTILLEVKPFPCRNDGIDFCGAVMVLPF